MLKLHTLAYLALSSAYTGACFGIDDTAIKIATAALYLLLALDTLKARH